MTDATPLQTQADRLAEARKKQEQRENGIRAQAVKHGRELERAEMLRALGVQRLEDASTSAQLRAERDARPTRDEELKHGRHRFYQGMWIGSVMGGALIAVAASWLLSEAFRQAGTYGREMAVTGAIAQGVNAPEPCIPGSTLQDGRVCPQR